MNTGAVKFYNVERGYGFIVNDADTSKGFNSHSDDFVHVSDLLASGIRAPLIEGQRVSYELKKGREVRKS